MRRIGDFFGVLIISARITCAAHSGDALPVFWLRIGALSGPDVPLPTSFIDVPVP
jgi:hypothetical protein